MKKGFLDQSKGKKAAPKKKENAPPKSTERGPTEDEVKNRFRQLIAQANELRGKIGELEGDKVEHSLVLDVFKDLNEDRKCFRKISGVLVERTVGQVRPAIQDNLDKLSTVVKQLEGKIKAKEQEIDKFKKDWNIKLTTEGSPQGAQ